MKRQTLLFAMAVALLALAIVPHFLKSYGVHLLTYWLVYILAVMGLNLTVGYAGQKSLQKKYLSLGLNEYDTFFAKPKARQEVIHECH